jgi:hypothetical protein
LIVWVRSAWNLPASICADAQGNEKREAKEPGDITGVWEDQGKIEKEVLPSLCRIEIEQRVSSGLRGRLANLRRVNMTETLGFGR